MSVHITAFPSTCTFNLNQAGCKQINSCANKSTCSDYPLKNQKQTTIILCIAIILACTQAKNTRGSHTNAGPVRRFATMIKIDQGSKKIRVTIKKPPSKIKSILIMIKIPSACSYNVHAFPFTSITPL